MAAEPTKRERERLALEAKRLTADETLILAIANIRKTAVDALIAADANKITDVVRLQAKVSVCDEFMSELDQMITLQNIEEKPVQFV